MAGGEAVGSAAHALAGESPIWVERGRLLPRDARPEDQFGGPIALDGDTAVIGYAWGDAAHVFARSETGWSEVAKLQGSDAQCFGRSTAVLGDVALVSEHCEPGDAAYVFVRSGTTWSEQAKLASRGIASPGILGVALSGDTALVGTDNGAVVFTRSGTTWSEQGTLDVKGFNSFTYRESVALSGDTALLNTKVFVREGTAWSEQPSLDHPERPTWEFFDYYGDSVALDGDTALVGAWLHTADVAGQGAVYVFVRTGTTWAVQARLTASDGVYFDQFGWSVALSGDVAVIGAPHVEEDPGTVKGAVYVFERSGTTWTERHKLRARGGFDGDKPYYRLGSSVAFSGDTIMAWGSPWLIGESVVEAFHVHVFMAGDPGGAACTEGGSCATGVCTDGACASPCAPDLERPCEGGFACADGACPSSCATDADCANGFQCAGASCECVASSCDPALADAGPDGGMDADGGDDGGREPRASADSEGGEAGCGCRIQRSRSPAAPSLASLGVAWIAALAAASRRRRTTR